MGFFGYVLVAVEGVRRCSRVLHLGTLQNSPLAPVNLCPCFLFLFRGCCSLTASPGQTQSALPNPVARCSFGGFGSQENEVPRAGEQRHRPGAHSPVFWEETLVSLRREVGVGEYLTQGYLFLSLKVLGTVDL